MRQVCTIFYDEILQAMHLLLFQGKDYGPVRVPIVYICGIPLDSFCAVFQCTPLASRSGSTALRNLILWPVIDHCPDALLRKVLGLSRKDVAFGMACPVWAYSDAQCEPWRRTSFRGYVVLKEDERVLLHMRNGLRIGPLAQNSSLKTFYPHKYDTPSLSPFPCLFAASEKDAGEQLAEFGQGFEKGVGPRDLDYPLPSGIATIQGCS